MRKLIRLLFICVPLALLIFQLFWQPPLNQPGPFKRALQAVLPPMSFVLRYIDFNQRNSLVHWEEKVFRGKVAYWIEFENASAHLPAGQGFVHALSKGTSSAIFYKIKYKISDYPVISWKWRVQKFPDKSGAQNAKAKDDFAARFYVVFLSSFFTQFRCVEYVWDETIPEETLLQSPYSNQIKQIVVQTGPATAGEWVQETRNVMNDYEKLFGEKPSMKVAAIALMSDSEGTKAEAEAFFDDIRIGKTRLVSPLQ